MLHSVDWVTEIQKHAAVFLDSYYLCFDYNAFTETNTEESVKLEMAIYMQHFNHGI